MDHQQLQAFISVAELQSFSRAAEHLHLTQPAVSKRISCLEQALGLKLFDRIGHRIHLSPAGASLLPRAKRLLYDLEDAVTELRNLSGQVAGTLRIATSHHVGLRHLPSILQVYTQRFPDVVLEFDFVDSERAFHEVLQGMRELAIITLPDPPPESVLCIPLWIEHLRPCAHVRHPLAQRKTLSPDMLSQHRAILLPEHTFTQLRANEVFQQAGIALADYTSSTYLEAIAMLVTANQGWALLPEVFCNDEIVALKLDPEVVLTRILGVAIHKERTLSNAARAMLDILTEASRRFSSDAAAGIHQEPGR